MKRWRGRNWATISCAMERRALIHEDLTGSVIGAFYDVYNTLGFGFLEHVYAMALEREFRSRGTRWGGRSRSLCTRATSSAANGLTYFRLRLFPRAVPDRRRGGRRPRRVLSRARVPRGATGRGPRAAPTARSAGTTSRR